MHAMIGMEDKFTATVKIIGKCSRSHSATIETQVIIIK